MCRRGARSCGADSQCPTDRGGSLARPTRIVLIALLGCALLAPPAAATHVSCGDTITQDTTLDSDLVGCAGDGLVIGADGVTVDLGGHRIDGAGAGAGIRSENFSGLEIRGG